jgi:hypothetical protein
MDILELYYIFDFWTMRAARAARAALYDYLEWYEQADQPGYWVVDELEVKPRVTVVEGFVVVRL